MWAKQAACTVWVKKSAETSYIFDVFPKNLIFLHVNHPLLEALVPINCVLYIWMQTSVIKQSFAFDGPSVEQSATCSVWQVVKLYLHRRCVSAILAPSTSADIVTRKIHLFTNQLLWNITHTVWQTLNWRMLTWNFNDKQLPLADNCYNRICLNFTINLEIVLLLRQFLLDWLIE